MTQNEYTKQELAKLDAMLQTCSTEDAYFDMIDVILDKDNTDKSIDEIAATLTA